MLDFYNNYKTAVVGSGVPGADEALVASVMGAIADRCSMPPAACMTPNHRAHLQAACCRDRLPESVLQAATHAEAAEHDAFQLRC